MILRCRRRRCLFIFYWFCPRGPCPQRNLSGGGKCRQSDSLCCVSSFFTSLAKTHLSRFDERIPSAEQRLRLHFKVTGEDMKRSA